VAACIALAATLSPAFAASPVALESLSMRVQPADSVLLVSGAVSSTTQLPVTLTLPIPSGTTPYWVGEILGGDPSKDPKATYTIRKANGYDLVVFTLTQARTGQAEVNIPAAAVGAPSTLAYSLPVVSKVTLATLTMQLPVGSSVTSSSAGFTSSQGQSGELVLTKTVQNPKVGSAVSGAVTFSGGAAAPAAGTPAAAGPSSSPTAPGDVADALALPLWILVIVLGGLFAGELLRRRRAAALAAAGDEQGDEGDEDEDEDDLPPVDNDSAFDDDEPRASRTKNVKKPAPASQSKQEAQVAEAPKRATPRKKD
jgi:hypothetical protein